MHRAFSSMASGEGFVPHRYVTSLPNGKLVMLCKPAFVEQEQKVTVKFLTQREGVVIPGVPTIQGVVMVIDAQSGELLSIMDGEYLTALRTGAASGLATRFFARKDAATMALFGCGTQGSTQLEAVLSERELTRVLVYDTNEAAARTFCKEMSATFNVDCKYTERTSDLAMVDVICTATNATRPLFYREDIQQGVHINAIGSFQPHMQELDPRVLKDARVYVDTAKACLEESGDLVRAISAGIIQKDHIVGEIGEYCIGRITGRKDDNEITLFKSVGVAIQDFMVATDIYHASLDNSFGTDLDLYR